MDQLEKVEKLREKANVSYEEAKQALEESNWDMLDAMVALEKQGKVKGPGSTSYKTYSEKTSEVFHGEVVKDNEKHSGFGDMLGRFFAWCGKVIKKGMENCLVIERESQKSVDIPVLVFIMLLFMAFWVVMPLLVIGLFFGFRYSFNGPDMSGNNTNGVNDALNKASKSAEDFKEEFKNGYNK